MKVFICITIDVEPDCSPTWHYSVPLDFKSVSEGIGTRLHPLFLEFAIQPTYLINNVVLENDNSVAVLRNLKGVYELGTHLHGDFIEPGKIHTDYAGKDGVVNQCQLPPEIEFGKLATITTLFKKQFGYAPVSFRAGRFSAGGNTIKSLAKLGYKVDTSVSPKITWKDAGRERPVDFTQAPNQPYWTSEESFPMPSENRELLQVPISIIDAYKYLFFKRAKWLRPFYSDANGMIQVAKQVIKTNRDKEMVVLNMMFHNVEVMPLLNPYTKTEKDVQVYMDSLKRFFEFCRKQAIEPATLSSVYNYYSLPE